MNVFQLNILITQRLNHYQDRVMKWLSNITFLVDATDCLNYLNISL
jgi:hypothetical protein